MVPLQDGTTIGPRLMLSVHSSAGGVSIIASSGHSGIEVVVPSQQSVPDEWISDKSPFSATSSSKIAEMHTPRSQRQPECKRLSILADPEFTRRRGVMGSAHALNAAPRDRLGVRVSREPKPNFTKIWQTVDFSQDPSVWLNVDVLYSHIK